MLAQSYLSPNLYSLYEAVASSFAQVAGNNEVLFRQAAYDIMDDIYLSSGEVDIAFACGLPLSRLESEGRGLLVPILAPVMDAARYDKKPVYFSDIITRVEVHAERLEDLRGSVFTYNDSGSHSGYNAPRYAMLQRGLTDGFFGNITQSHAHVRSVQAVILGNADCASIDSIVLEQELRSDPTLRERLKVVESLGPYPNPPVAIHKTWLKRKSVAAWADELIRAIPESILQEAHIARYQPVGFADYEVLYKMFDAAQVAGFTTIR